LLLLLLSRLVLVVFWTLSWLFSKTLTWTSGFVLWALFSRFRLTSTKSFLCDFFNVEALGRGEHGTVYKCVGKCVFGVRARVAVALKH